MSDIEKMVFELELDNGDLIVRAKATGDILKTLKQDFESIGTSVESAEKDMKRLSAAMADLAKKAADTSKVTAAMERMVGVFEKFSTLDPSKIRETARAVSISADAFDKMGKSLTTANASQLKDLAKGLSQVNTISGRIKQGAGDAISELAKALNTLSPINPEKAKKVASSMLEIGAAMDILRGVSTKGLDDAINGIVDLTAGLELLSKVDFGGVRRATNNLGNLAQLMSAVSQLSAIRVDYRNLNAGVAGLSKLLTTLSGLTGIDTAKLSHLATATANLGAGLTALTSVRSSSLNSIGRAMVNMAGSFAQLQGNMSAFHNVAAALTSVNNALARLAANLRHVAVSTSVINRTASGVRQLGTNAQVSQRHVGGLMERLRDFTIVGYGVHNVLSSIDTLFTSWLAPITRANAELERLGVLLKGVNQGGTPQQVDANAKGDMAFILNMAKSTPVALTELSNAFVKFKSVNLKEPERALRALSDAVAHFGGSDQEFHRAAVAIQQMAGKGVISMEELRQQLGEAVPSAIKLMARSMNMTYSDLVNHISKGEVMAAEALQRMTLEFEIAFGGSAKNMMGTWDGMVSRLKTTWMEFAKVIGDAGYFNAAKDALKEMIHLMESSEGKAFAVSLGASLGNFTRALIDATKWVRQHWQEIKTATKYAVEFIAVWKGISIVNGILAGLTAGMARFVASMAGISLVGNMGTVSGAFAGLTTAVGAARTATIGFGSVARALSAAWMPALTIAITGAIALWEKYSSATTKALDDTQDKMRQSQRLEGKDVGTREEAVKRMLESEKAIAETRALIAKREQEIVSVQQRGRGYGALTPEQKKATVDAAAKNDAQLQDLRKKLVDFGNDYEMMWRRTGEIAKEGASAVKREMLDAISEQNRAVYDQVEKDLSDAQDKFEKAGGEQNKAAAKENLDTRIKLLQARYDADVKAVTKMVEDAKAQQAGANDILSEQLREKLGIYDKYLAERRRQYDEEVALANKQFDKAQKTDNKAVQYMASKIVQDFSNVLAKLEQNKAQLLDLGDSGYAEKAQVKTDAMLKNMLGAMPGGKGLGGNVATAMEFFASKGLDAQSAAAIVGNLMQESGPSLDPSVTNEKGAHGIAQWLDTRKKDLADFAAATKGSVDDITTQLNFLWKELTDPEQMRRSGTSGVLKALMAANGLGDKTISVRKTFERPKEFEAADDKRLAFANTALLAGGMPPENPAQGLLERANKGEVTAAELVSLREASKALHQQAEEDDKIIQQRKKMVELAQEYNVLVTKGSEEGKHASLFNLLNSKNDNVLADLQSPNKQISDQAFNMIRQASANDALKIAQNREENARFIETYMHGLVREIATGQKNLVKKNDPAYAMQLQQEARMDFFNNGERMREIEKRGTAEQIAQYKELLSQLDALNKKEQEIADWRGIYDLAATWDNAMLRMRDASAEWIDGFSNVLTQFVVTGKMKFADFVKSVLAGIANIAIQKSLITFAQVGAEASGVGWLQQLLSVGGSIAMGAAGAGAGSAIDSATNGVGAVGQAMVKSGAGAGWGMGFGFTDGGYISGPGSKTSDSIPAMLSNGEFVIPARLVDKNGRGAFEALLRGQQVILNSGSRHFANGGYVGGGRHSGIGHSSRGGDNINIGITVNNDGGTKHDSGSDSKKWNDMAENIRVAVVKEIANQKRPGGILNR